MDINCSDEELFIFKQVADSAAELGMPVFIIGGFVRDKILNRDTKDADIVCIGDGIEKRRQGNFLRCLLLISLKTSVRHR